MFQAATSQAVLACLSMRVIYQLTARGLCNCHAAMSVVYNGIFSILGTFLTCICAVIKIQTIYASLPRRSNVCERGLRGNYDTILLQMLPWVEVMKIITKKIVQ
jgi:hypothetical protein